MPSAARTEERGTRQRVLAIALALFNERGLANVTTAEIAGTARIREGNLHYHFSKKAQLITALFDALEDQALRIAGRRFDRHDPAEYADYQRAWFRLMWDFRCFYRDAVAAQQIARGLRPRMRAVHGRTQELVRRVLDEAVAHGLMRATPRELDRLLSNIWIVSSYWMDYLRLRTQGVDLQRQHLEWGYAQVQSLYAPYLTRKGAALADGRLASEAPALVAVAGGRSRPRRAQC